MPRHERQTQSKSARPCGGAVEGRWLPSCAGPLRDLRLSRLPSKSAQLHDVPCERRHVSKAVVVDTALPRIEGPIAVGKGRHQTFELFRVWLHLVGQGGVEHVDE